MWFLLRSILIVGILMGYQNLAFAHDAHVTHLSQSISFGQVIEFGYYFGRNARRTLHQKKTWHS